MVLLLPLSEALLALEAAGALGAAQARAQALRVAFVGAACAIVCYARLRRNLIPYLQSAIDSHCLKITFKTYNISGAVAPPKSFHIRQTGLRINKFFCDIKLLDMSTDTVRQYSGLLFLSTLA